MEALVTSSHACLRRNSVLWHKKCIRRSRHTRCTRSVHPPLVTTAYNHARRVEQLSKTILNGRRAIGSCFAILTTLANVPQEQQCCSQSSTVPPRSGVVRRVRREAWLCVGGCAAACRSLRRRRSAPRTGGHAQCAMRRVKKRTREAFLSNIPWQTYATCAHSLPGVQLKYSTSGYIIF